MKVKLSRRKENRADPPLAGLKVSHRFMNSDLSRQFQIGQHGTIAGLVGRDKFDGGRGDIWFGRLLLWFRFDVCSASSASTDGGVDSLGVSGLPNQRLPSVLGTKLAMPAIVVQRHFIKYLVNVLVDEHMNHPNRNVFVL